MSPHGTLSPFHSGALSTNLRSCALAARADGLEVLVLARQSPHPAYDDVRAHFVPFPAPKNPLSTLVARLDRKLFGWPHLGHRVYAARLARALSRPELQNVPWIISNDPDLAVFLRARFPNAFLVHRFHNQMTARPSVRKKLAGALNACVAVSDFTRDWIQNYYNFAPGKVKTVYNGVDASLFHPAPTPPPGPPVLNFVGRTGIEKGADLLLDAALLLAKTSKPAFSLQIVGANNWTGLELDNYQLKLRERVEALEKLGVSVRQTGHINRMDVPDQFRRAHIHIVPSRWDEPFGLTTVEGMASGLATVASNTGGSPEIIADAGFLFERDNASDLAQKLEPLLSDENLRRDYGARARVRAEQFSWQNTWRGLREAVQL